MKASLQLRLSQHLALTPQLQQSIRLLQLSTLELQQEVAMAVSQNPLLENEDDWTASPLRVAADGSLITQALRCARPTDEEQRHVVEQQQTERAENGEPQASTNTTAWVRRTTARIPVRGTSRTPAAPNNAFGRRRPAPIAIHESATIAARPPDVRNCA